MRDESERCRKNAEACEQQGKGVADIALRQAYADLAQEWRKLAESIDRNARTRRSPQR